MLALIVDSKRMEKGNSPIPLCQIEGNIKDIIADLTVGISYIYGALKDNDDETADAFRKTLVGALSKGGFNPVWNGVIYNINKREAEMSGADECAFRNTMLKVDKNELRKQAEELAKEKGGEQE